MTKRGRGAAPIHPGEILLKEFLDQYEPPVSQVEAAARMHVPTVRLNQLIRGHRGVTPDTALRLADLTGTSAEFWMNLQCRYDLWHAAHARADRKDSKIRSLRIRTTGQTASRAQTLVGALRESVDGAAAGKARGNAGARRSRQDERRRA